MAQVTLTSESVDKLAAEMALDYHRGPAQRLTPLFRAEAPIDTGELRASHQPPDAPVKVAGGWRIRWEATADHAQIVYAGRGVVRPVRAKALRWVTKTGEVVFAMRSRAVPPNRWFNRVFTRLGFQDVRTETR